MWTWHTSGDLPKELFLYFDKLGRLDHIQDFFDLAKKHDLKWKTMFD